MPNGDLTFIGVSKFRGYWNASSNAALSGGLVYSGSHVSGGYNNGAIGEPSGSGLISVGEYWQVNTAGSTNLDGTSSWQVSDWCVYGSDSKWQKVGYAETISSIVVGSTDLTTLSSALLVSSSNTQILFNSGSEFSGSKNLTYDYQTGIMRMTGSLFVSGTLTANEYKVNVVNQSVINLSATGSTSFGDTLDDTHIFSGSVNVTGTVGIGTNSPTAVLHVSARSASEKLLHVEDYSGADILFVTSSGQVGIGTASPLANLHIDGATNSDVSLQMNVDENSKKATIRLAESNPITDHNYEGGFIQYDAGTNLLHIGAHDGNDQNTANDHNVITIPRSSRNVGIGVTDPDSLLEIFGTSTQLKLSYDATDFATFTVDTNHDLTITPSSTGQIKLQPTTDSTDFFQVLDADGGTPVLNVDSTNERVGIGTATPTSKLSVNGQTDLTGSVLPGADNTYDLGSSAHRWANIYTGDLHLKNHKGDWTIVEEEDYLEVINNKTCKKYKMVLQEIED
jgi:hypothetical protein